MLSDRAGVTGLVRLSVNEAQTMCTRAAAGAGVPFGLAQDCAAAATWLAQCGLKGFKVFHHALRCFLAAEAVAVTRDEAADGYRLVPVLAGRSASSLFAGPALSDLARACAGGFASLSAASVDQPLLAAACIASADGRAPLPLTVEWGRAGHALHCSLMFEDDGCSLWANGVESCETQPAASVAIEIGSSLEHGGLKCLLTPADIELATRRGYETGIEADDTAYEWLAVRAREILVPDSPRSRHSGAGAGLSDND